MTSSPPSLTWWSSTWRYVLVVAISAAAWPELAQWQLKHAPAWFVVDGLVGLVSLVLLRWRRRYPVFVALFTNLVALGSYASSGPATLSLVSLATRRKWRELVPVSLAILASLPVVVLVDPLVSSEPSVDLAVIVVLVGLMVGWGLFIGSRRELLASLRARAEMAESEQTAKVAQARSAERTRIAREMHDVLAHRISLVTMHAGALAYRDDLDRGQVQQTARTIQDSAAQAMSELRDVLGVLRDEPGDAVPELPQPSATDLTALVDEWRAAGMRIELDVHGDLDVVPLAQGRTLFRVVQEALTNARKHASGTVTVVRIRVTPAEGVWSVIDNPLQIGSRSTLPGGGFGLVGLAERVELAGGRLEHEVTPARHFVLKVWLPWPP